MYSLSIKKNYTGNFFFFCENTYALNRENNTISVEKKFRKIPNKEKFKFSVKILMLLIGNNPSFLLRKYLVR